MMEGLADRDSQAEAAGGVQTEIVGVFITVDDALCLMLPMCAHLSPGGMLGTPCHHPMNFKRFSQVFRAVFARYNSWNLSFG